MILIIVICFLLDKESLILNPTIKTLTSLLNFVLEAYLFDLVLVSLDKYLQMKVCMIFQSIIILLIDLAC